MGTPLGAWLGEKVGVFVGAIVGNVVGAAVGRTVGTVLGAALGDRVGAFDGAAVHPEHPDTPCPSHANPPWQEQVLKEHVASPQLHVPCVWSHVENSATVQPPGWVGDCVGIFVGALLGIGVGALVGGSVGHATCCKSTMIAFSALNSAVM